MSTGTAGLDGLLKAHHDRYLAAPPVWETATILAHERYADRYHRLRLHSPDLARSARPGQFVMVNVNEGDGSDILLPRPMAIHRWDAEHGTIDLVYNVVGRGTAVLRTTQHGENRVVTGPLGRGFTIPDGAQRVLLIGRGVGICSVVGLAEFAIRNGLEVHVLISSQSVEAPGIDDLADLGVPVTLVTDADGTSDVSHVRRRLDDLYAGEPPEYVAVCGSNRLIRLASRLGREWDAVVEASVEAHMACGLGYCHGCAAPIAQEPTTEGPLVCVDGPVFEIETS